MINHRLFALGDHFTSLVTLDLVSSNDAVDGRLHHQLTNWARAAAHAEAKAQREAAGWKEQLATEEATLEGLLLDLFERRLEATINISNGRVHRGRITKASTTLIEIQPFEDHNSNRPKLTWIARPAITAVSIVAIPNIADNNITQISKKPSSNRTLPDHPALVSEITKVSADHPSVRIWLAGLKDCIAGRLLWAGKDVAAIETPAGVTHVNLNALVEIELG